MMNQNLRHRKGNQVNPEREPLLGSSNSTYSENNVNYTSTDEKKCNNNNNNNTAHRPLSATQTNSSSSSYLQVVLDALFSMLRDIVNNSFSWSFSNPETTSSSSSSSFSSSSSVKSYQLEKLKECKQKWAQKFDETEQKHEQLLLFLWKLSFPEESLLSRKSPQWKKLGFQGVDPATDFRGVGLLGLKNLVHLARTYPTKYQAMIKGRAPLEEYPFAVAGLNVTMMIFDMLGVGSRSHSQTSFPSQKILCELIFSSTTEPNSFFSKNTKQQQQKQQQQRDLISFDDKEEQEQEQEQEQEEQEQEEQELDEIHDCFEEKAFSEIFCLCFFILDSKWYQLKGSYLQFNHILSEAQKEAEKTLCSVQSLHHLKALIHQQFTLQ